MIESQIMLNSESRNKNGRLVIKLLKYATLKIIIPLDCFSRLNSPGSKDHRKKPWIGKNGSSAQVSLAIESLVAFKLENRWLQDLEVPVDCRENPFLNPFLH